MNEKTDEQIVKQILHGDNDAFKIIVERYQKQVFNIGFRFFKNEYDSYDFVQEIFIKVFQKQNTFKEFSPFRFWLMKIAYNAGINSIKAFKNDGSIDDLVVPSEEKDPEKKHIEKEIRELLLNAINKLPERYKICLDFYFFYRFSYIEISSITGYPINTIKSHVFRAKKELQIALSGTIAEEYHEL